MGWIYLIINKINGKLYIGQTQRLSKRKIEHQKYTTNQHLRNAINLYGWDNFVFVSWKQISIDKLNQEEARWAIFFDCVYPNGYNLVLPDGQGSYIRSEEVIKKQRNAKLGKRFTEEHKKRISKNNKGKHILTPEHKQKLLMIRKGIPLTEETKQKIRDKRALQIMKPHTEETKQKMSNAHKGKVGPNKGGHLSEEHKQKISRSKKGKSFSDSHKENLSKSCKGKIISEEVKRKISFTMKQRKMKTINSTEGENYYDA